MGGDKTDTLGGEIPRCFLAEASKETSSVQAA